MERMSLTLDDLPGPPVEVPYAAATGHEEGPHLTLVAGVHGAEYTGMAALLRLISTLDTTRLRGRLTVVPVLNQPAFWSRTPFVVPADGVNLNRSFPGDPAGEYTAALAHGLFEAFIRPTDVLVDLHAGDLPEALEPFCLYEESAVQERARELALVYGTGHVVRQTRAARTVGGSTSAAAADIGVPAITAEIGSNGICDAASVAGHRQGVLNVLASLEMLPADVAVPVPAPVEHEGWVWVRTPVRGFWQASVAVGWAVRTGDVLGVLLDPWGAEVHRVVAPADGVPLFLTSSPAVDADGLLLGLARA
ncbi:succinylglutamate desuccinylase/aspartoacylase family protein [Modestobacter sp. VKM Ac-2986]|uniref:succinylglutamate desuccinylase/aspartoacylase family protein n=1 Tax=Modestobacter sp. VKM Ac-2986 TaxID=3004140 RepID=UPI0022AB57C9|nr:succinylglutamate desuccinylase/aspartoacylase family protein [Modestobacter sp. VKM Ac-2986]MCZ2830714.1 succinylglutamate desuccinylase/aspartoacylase family protein [Modestobacter sp. VKM Ac-2986]